jgi:hypothetical protein
MSLKFDEISGGLSAFDFCARTLPGALPRAGIEWAFGPWQVKRISRLNTLVARNIGVDGAGPGVDASREGLGLGEALFA